MIIGEIKNKIDKIWITFHSGGIANPLSVIEQITYLKDLMKFTQPKRRRLIYWAMRL